MATINIRPSILNLMLYAGDGVEFRLICTDSAGQPVDITGAVRAQVRANRLTGTEPPLAEFTVGLTDAYQGIIVLSLTDDQTQGLVNSSGKFKGVWDVSWEPADGQTRTLCQGDVECVADVTR